MNTQEKRNWLAYYKRNNLPTLGRWLFTNPFELLLDQLDKDLISIHSSLSVFEKQALTEVNDFWLKFGADKATSVIHTSLDHLNERLEELSAFAEGIDNPINTIYELHTINGQLIEIESAMDEGLDGFAIGAIHKRTIQPSLINEIDFIEACTWLDDHFDLEAGEFQRFFATYSASFKKQVLEFLIEYLESIQDQIQLYLPKGMDTTEIIYPNLIDLFKNPEEFDELIALLREVEPPVINSDGHYILGERKKGAIAAFFSVLKDRGKLKKHYPKTLKPLVDAQFAMKISRRILSKCESNPFYTYREAFESLLPKA